MHIVHVCVNEREREREREREMEEWERHTQLDWIHMHTYAYRDCVCFSHSALSLDLSPFFKQPTAHMFSCECSTPIAESLVQMVLDQGSSDTLLP